jgi:hypothetical protein
VARCKSGGPLLARASYKAELAFALVVECYHQNEKEFFLHDLLCGGTSVCGVLQWLEQISVRNKGKTQWLHLVVVKMGQH